MGLQNLVVSNTVETVMDTLMRICRTGTKDQCAIVVLLCWSLWFRRNKWVWERVSTSVFGIKAMALNLLAD